MDGGERLSAVRFRLTRQPGSPSARQLCSISALQPFSPAVLQSCSKAAFQPFKKSSRRGRRGHGQVRSRPCGEVHVDRSSTRWHRAV